VSDVPESSFDGRAGRYDEQRPADGNWWELYERVVELGALQGRRVLEVGCGTGRLAAALTEGAQARVRAIDRSVRMVERARSRGVEAEVANAEELPFPAASFDAVVLRMVIHLIDRPRALAEAARVLTADGRVVIATEDPASFERVWFARYFPSVPAIDRGRFPDAETLCAELTRAGLRDAHITALPQRRRLDRATALDLARSKAYSTFDLIEPDEYAGGLERAEAELPALVHSRFDWLIAVARR
jgi:ubiquinone/menaquinone biosynthesis C-methylase UbiE